MRRITLQKLMIIFSAILALLGIVTSLFLIILTTRLDNSILKISNVIESIQTASQIEMNLLIHNRESFLYGISEDTKHNKKREIEKINLEKNINKSRQYTDNAFEKQLIDELAEKINLYFITRKKMESEGLPSIEIYDNVSFPLEDAFRQVRRLIQYNQHQADQLQRATRQANKIADITGIVIIAIFISSIVLSIVFFKRSIYDPLISFKKGMDQFSFSNYSIRIPAQGPKEIIEIADAFNEMGNRINEDMQAHYRFLAAISHDLRTPLTAIIMSSQFLEQEETDTEKKSLIDIINRQANYLNHMVGDLIDAARVEAKKLELNLKKEDIRSIIYEVVELHKQTTSIHTISVLSPNEPVICNIDPGRITQVLNNLINNAIKYSPLGGTIYVEVIKQVNEIVINVTDEGIGVAKDEEEKIFEPFRRSQKTKKTIPGIGLGLSTSKRIIEAHKGQIKINSIVGKGTTFSIVLPL